MRLVAVKCLWTVLSKAIPAFAVSSSPSSAKLHVTLETVLVRLVLFVSLVRLTELVLSSML